MAMSARMSRSGGGPNGTRDRTRPRREPRPALPRSRPRNRLADEAAEHAAGGGQVVARKGHLAGIGLAVLGIEGGAGPGVVAMRLHVEEHLLADPGRAARVLEPGDRAAQ